MTPGEACGEDGRPVVPPVMGVDDLDATPAEDPGHAGDVPQLDEPFVTGVLQRHTRTDRHLGLLPVPRARESHIDTRLMETDRKFHTLVICSTPVEQSVEL